MDFVILITSLCKIIIINNILYRYTSSNLKNDTKKNDYFLLHF